VNLLRGLSYLTVDSLRGEVVFGVGESYRTNRFVTRVPLGWQNNLPCVSLAVDGQGPYSCVVDTGGNYGLLLSRAQATKLGYWREGKGKVASSSGVAGAGLAATYNVRRAVLGGATFVSVPGRTIVIGPEPAGGQMLIGNEVLRRYRVTFDFRNQQFWLEN
jgi:predicted aspartyl protease